MTDNVARRPGEAPRLFVVSDQPDEPGGELVVPQETVPVLEGEVVGRPRAAVATVKAVVTDVAKHNRTKTAARHVLYVAVGVVAVGRRLWDSRTTARYERMMRSAEAAGNHESALEWEARAAQFRNDRHQRRMELLAVPVRVAVMLPTLAAGAVGILIGIGILLAAANHDARQISTPMLAVAGFVRFVVVVVGVVWGPLILAAPWVVVLALWQVGRSYAALPAWAMTPAQRAAETGGGPITPSIVVVALRDLGIPALRTAVKAMGDAGAGMLGPIRIAGCGVEVDVLLPSGVSTEEVQNRRRKLAENLDRHEHEVFIVIPQAARSVRLWIADSGALDEPIGPSPLVTDPDLTADYYTGRAPWGQDLRGDAALVRLKQRHVLITGLSNQGKTAALRSLALWLALDPSVEFRIGDLKGVGDWRMFDGIATVLIQGPTDEHVIAVTEMVEEAVAEMERRLVALEQSGATDGVTREMARAGIGFHPIVVLVDEAQVAFMCPAKGDDGRPYGGTKATSRYFMAVRKIQNQGRAVNVVKWQGTQDPTDQNLPKLVREGAHLRASLVLGTEAQAKMALGETPVDLGAAPHKLRQGLDKGTLVAISDALDIPAGQPSITVRTHFVSGEQAAVIADRAKDRREPVTASTRMLKPEVRILLADLDKVMGTERVKLTDLVSLLRNLAPDFPPYQRLNGVQLQTLLGREDVRVTNTGNVPRLDPADLRSVLAEREAADPDEG